MCGLNKCKLNFSQIHLTHSWCCKMLDKYCKTPVKYFGKIPSCIQLIDNASGINCMKYWEILWKRLQQQVVKEAERAEFFSFGSNNVLLFRFFSHIGLVLLWRKAGEAGRALLRLSSASSMCKAGSVRAFLMKNEAGYTRQCTWHFRKLPEGKEEEERVVGSEKRKCGWLQRLL